MAFSTTGHSLSATPSTYGHNIINVHNDLIVRIKQNLGYPVVDVEICDDVIGDYVNQAVELYTKYAGHTEEYIAFDSKNYPVGRGIHLPTVIETLYETYQGDDTSLSAVYVDDQLNDTRKVLNVFSFDPAEFTGTDALFTLEYVYAQQAYYSVQLGGFGFDLITWETLKQFLDLRKKMFSSTPRVLFDVRTQRMRLIPEPTDDKGFIGVIGCYMERPVSDLLKERWVQQYSLALTKIAIGNVRSKYSGVTLFGGGSINGSDLLSQGLKEKETLEQELLNDVGEAELPMFFIG